MDQNGHLKLADFGLSKDGMYADEDKTNTFCGTAEYIAPEVLIREGHDKCVDWWSLVNPITFPLVLLYLKGILLYEMITGRGPFHARSRK